MSNLEIHNYEPKTITLPKVVDAEYNSWTIKVYDSSKKTLPRFIELHEGELIIRPTSYKNVGKYIL